MPHMRSATGSSVIMPQRAKALDLSAMAVASMMISTNPSSLFPEIPFQERDYEIICHTQIELGVADCGFRLWTDHKSAGRAASGSDGTGFFSKCLTA